MNPSMQIRLWASVVLGVLALTGCTERKYEKVHYVLAPHPSAPLAERTPNEAVLEVRRFTIDSIFAGRQEVKLVSQRKRLTWERFGDLLRDLPLPRPRITVRIWGP